MNAKFTEGILPETCDFPGPPQLYWHKYSSWSCSWKENVTGGIVSCELIENIYFIYALSPWHKAPRTLVIF